MGHNATDPTASPALASPGLRSAPRAWQTPPAMAVIVLLVLTGWALLAGGVVARLPDLIAERLALAAIANGGADLAGLAGWAELIRAHGAGPVLAAWPAASLARWLGMPHLAPALAMALRVVLAATAALILMRGLAGEAGWRHPHDKGADAALLFAVGLGGAISAFGSTGLAVVTLALVQGFVSQLRPTLEQAPGWQLSLPTATGGAVIGLFGGFPGLAAGALLMLVVALRDARLGQRLARIGGLSLGLALGLALASLAGPLPSASVEAMPALRLWLLAITPLGLSFLIMTFYWHARDYAMLTILPMVTAVALVLPSVPTLMMLIVMLIVISAHLVPRFPEMWRISWPWRATSMGLLALPPLTLLATGPFIDLQEGGSDPLLWPQALIGLLMLILATGGLALLFRRRFRRGQSGRVRGLLLALSALSAAYLATELRQRDLATGPHAEALSALAGALPACLPHIDTVELWALDDKVALHLGGLVARVHHVSEQDILTRRARPDTILIMPETIDPATLERAISGASGPAIEFGWIGSGESRLTAYILSPGALVMHRCGNRAL